MRTKYQISKSINRKMDILAGENIFRAEGISPERRSLHAFDLRGIAVAENNASQQIDIDDATGSSCGSQNSCHTPTAEESCSQEINKGIGGPSSPVSVGNMIEFSFDGKGVVLLELPFRLESDDGSGKQQEHPSQLLLGVALTKKIDQVLITTPSDDGSLAYSVNEVDERSDDSSICSLGSLSYSTSSVVEYLEEEFRFCIDH